MALSDILEALTLGGAGAVSGYASAKEQERARQERERARMDEQRYRQQMLDMRERELVESRLKEERDEQREMGRLGYRLARPDEPTGPMTFSPRNVQIPEYDFDSAELARPQTIPAPRVEGGRIAGTGAAAAPEQTFSAVARALEDYKGPEVRPAARERTYEGPEISLEAPERRGFERVDVGDRTYLRPDEELLKRIDTEREEAKKEEEIARKANSLFQSLGGEITMEQADAIVRANSDLGNYVMTPYQRASLEIQRARQAEGDDININTVRNRVDNMIRRGKEREFVDDIGNVQKVQEDYTLEEIAALVEEQARLYEKDPSDVYPDYDKIKAELAKGNPIGERQSEILQQSIMRSQPQAPLIDPFMDAELKLMFDQDTMSTRLNELNDELNENRRRGRRNFLDVATGRSIPSRGT